MRRLLGAALAAALLAAAGGCASVGGETAPVPVAVPLPAAVPDLQQRGLLLLMADQERFEPFVVETALTGDAVLREHLADALGRAGDPRGASYLGQLLADPEPAVRRAAAFALGELELGREDAGRAALGLLLAAVEPDRETAVLAVEALGKLGVSVTEVMRALTASELAEAERWTRLLPALYRFDEDAQVPVAEAGLAAAPDDELRRWAAYALSRTPRPAALPALRRLLADPDPRIRAWAARTVGLIGEAADLTLLVPLFEAGVTDADNAPRIQAVRAAAGLVERLRGEEVEVDLSGWPRRLAVLLGDPDPHLRLEAVDRAAPFLAAPDAGPLREALLGRVVSALEVAAESAAAKPESRTGANGSTRVEGTATVPATVEPSAAADAAIAEGAAALVALATAAADAPRSGPAPGAPPASSPLADLLTSAADSPRPLLRAAAATAAAELASTGAEDILERLLADSQPAVRSAAASARLALAEEAPPAEAAVLAARLLAGADPGLRAVAFSWLAEHPVVPYADLTRALQASLGDGGVEALLEAVPALRARGEAVAAERGGVVAVLEKVAERKGTDTAWLLRRAAAEALAALDRPAPPVGLPRGRRGPGVYEQIVLRTARPLHVEMVTDAGTLRLLVDCPRAPLTCLNFLQLAEQGLFDGVPFHRVVPDFVVQGGDPRGDGLGGPGYAIRDEIGRRRFTAGTLGMARAGPDTAGSQFFLTLSPQPHLDGAYTAFGEIAAGAEVLGAITRGTTIRSVREVP